MFCRVTALFLGFVTLASAGIASREERRPDAGWLFHRGDVIGAETPNFDDGTWTRVVLPHDWSIAGPVDSAAPAG